MIFDISSLKKTSENFHRATNTPNLEIGVKAKCKAFDMWAQILAGKNYSALASQVKLEPVKYTLDSSTIIEVFKHKNRVINESTAIRIFATSISSDIVHLSEITAALIRLLSEDESTSLVVGNGSELGIIKKDKSGYAPVSSMSFPNHERAEDHRQLIFAMSGHSTQRQLDIFCSMISCDGKNEDDAFFNLLRIRQDEFAVSVADYIFKDVTFRDSFDFLEASVKDAVHHFLQTNGFPDSRTFSLSSPVVSDFIESITGSVASAIEYYKEINEEGYDVDCFLLPIKRKVKIYSRQSTS